jgi:hypothetical protein
VLLVSARLARHDGPMPAPDGPGPRATRARRFRLATGGMIVGALLVLVSGLGQIAFAPERWLRLLGVLQVWLAGMVLAGVYFMARAERAAQPDRHR